MTSEQLERLLHESESPYLDFKRDQYRFIGATDEDKAELLKDIVAFANAWRRTDAFILIGVEEQKGERAKVHGVTSHFDDATLQQFVNSKTQRAIDFSVETLSVDGQKIDAIRIPVQRRPFYLKKDYARLKAGIVYFRRSTTTAEANPDEIAAMGEDAATSKASEPELHLQFADVQPILLGSPSYKELGTKLNLQLKPLDTSLLQTPLYPNLEILKKFGKQKSASEKIDDLLKSISRRGALEDATKGFHFALSNHGLAPALNVEAHLIIPRGTGLIVTTEAKMFPKDQASLDEILGRTSKGVHFETKPDCWKLTFRFERILPKYTHFSQEKYYFGATQPGQWQLNGTSYGDNLSAPNKSALFLAIEI